MDSYREHPSDFGPAFAGDVEADSSTQIDIGTDERRMHVRAYNYWASLLDGRDFPSIEDLEPGDLKDFAPHSVLLDFTSGGDAPATPYIGEAIRKECDLAENIRTISEVPSRSLLSRLTDHYMQIIANRAPVGFEAEFANQRGDNICYRGILMPFSSDGDTIDFIYGVINWKTAAAEDAAASTTLVPALPHDPDPSDPEEPEEADQAETYEIRGLADADDEILELGDELPILSPGDDDADQLPQIALDEDAALGDRLWAARETAEAAKGTEVRSRAALYRALSHAYDFALAAKADPDGYAELLEESGVKPQARAPMTPVVKLVFGIDYDKARLTEFAAALSFAERQEVPLGGFLPLIETQAGGLKALVAAERQARRPEAKADTRAEAARARLRAAKPVALGDISSDEEFALVLTRRRSDGSHEAIALVDDPGLVERAIRSAA